MSVKLKIVTTDFGADCDDQKAISSLVELLNVDDARAVTGLIDSLRAGEELAFIVSGPQPQLAAQAIGEKYHAKTGRYPLLTLGTQFEDKREDEIFSLTDGQPMLHKKSAASVLSQTAFQQAIDVKVKSGELREVEQIVIAPLHGELEYYNTRREELQADEVFQTAWAKVLKTATLQFQRTDEGVCKGNNYQKSAPGIAEGFLALLQEQGAETVFFEGAVAKAPEFMMSVTQKTQAGLQKSFESYIASMQVPWLYMTQAIGVTPSAVHMHAGMFTAGASFPFGVHVSAGTPAGFGLERALKEICGITRDDPEKFAAACKPIEAELERFDGAVLSAMQKKYPGITSVAQMREEMHSGMMSALQSFAEKKDIVESGEKIDSFTDFFKAVREKDIPLNPYNFMPAFTQELFAQSPVTQDITALAATEVAGSNHAQILSGALAVHGARAVVYDAVAVAAADAARENKALKSYFSEETTSGARVINITAAKVELLKEKSSHLHAVFVDRIRQALTIDGATLAQRMITPPQGPVRANLKPN